MTNDYLKSINTTGVTTYGNTKVKSSSTSDTSSSSSSTESSKSSSSSSGEVMGKTDFLNLLCEQLEQQDPLNPMDSQQFAAQLATFSQLEQLININDKLDNISTGSVSSMASFLGKEVKLADQTCTMSDGSGPNLVVDVPEGTLSLRVDFYDDDSNKIGSTTLEDVESGKQVLSLDNVDIDDGTYTAKVVAVDSSGSFSSLDSTVTGTVEGFVVDDSSLIVNGEEMALADVTEVFDGKK